MRRMLVFVVMVAVLVAVVPQSATAEVIIDSVITDSLSFPCCCLSLSHIREYLACVWAEMEVNWPLRPSVLPYDNRDYSLYIIACSNFPVGSFSISFEYYEGLELEGITWFDPFDDWEGVYCDTTHLADRRLRLMGWHDLGGEDNRYFMSLRPRRLIRIDFVSERPILFSHWPETRWPVRFLDDELTGPPAFGDTTGLLWFEASTFNDYDPREGWPPKIADQQDQLPAEFALQQNYPNPFNAVTLIQFALPKASDVVIEIYDILGRRVKELYSGFKPAGYHTVSWQARQVSSGVYFCHIRAGDFTAVRRMTVVK